MHTPGFSEAVGEAPDCWVYGAPRHRSRCGALRSWTAAQMSLRYRGGIVGRVQRSAISTQRNNRVDLVENLIVQNDVGAREQIIEELHLARPDDCGSHAGASHH